jgi:glucosylglycerol-phosphate synthase
LFAFLFTVANTSGDVMTSTDAPLALAQLTLATDLDGTFAHGSPAVRHALIQALTDAPDTCLLYVTGRSTEAWQHLATAAGLPTPDVAITDVGTEVADGRTGTPLAAFDHPIADWPGRGEVRGRLADLPLVEQPLAARWRVSYEFQNGYAADVVATARQRLLDLAVDVLPSADTYLDILPRGINKGTTLLRVLAHLGRPHERVVVAGDSLNDLALFESGLKGIVVGNAEPGLRTAVAGLTGLYFAAAEGVEGIVEGLNHFMTRQMAR